MDLVGLAVAVGVLSAVILIVVVIVLWVCHRWSRQVVDHYSNLTDFSWQIPVTDIKYFDFEKEEDEAQSSQSFLSGSTTFESENESRTDFGYYKEYPVAMKKFPITDNGLVKDLRQEMKVLTKLQHENIARIYGAFMNPVDAVLVTEYCIKGSLEELFLSEPSYLDDVFTASLVMDIIKGMTYLHENPIHTHGNLKSSNCLVTNRWVVKLSNFGLVNMRTQFKKQEDYIWSAPEVLSQKVIASQKSDVYSFGIILYEIIGKKGPFGRGYSYSNHEIQALLARICENHYHPETSWLCCEDYLKNIMLLCWNISPKLRPDFYALDKQLRPFKTLLNGNTIVDNMLMMMERYQMKLEDLVDERTKQLQQEKHKTENLLHRILPPQVAAQLISGKTVEPESFSCITVFISDICGYTSLASESTPIQVIQLLNDLYTLFDSIVKTYDVYKIETVGDSYLCVSGCPKPNGDVHAIEICLMALELTKALSSFTVTSYGDRKIQMRVGIHSGPCVAGVVGTSMPRYTLCGDTINVASRLETTSEPMKIQISTQTKELLDKHDNNFRCVKRGPVNIKGKGEMVTWWLESAYPPVITSQKQITLQVPGQGNSNRSSNASFCEIMMSDLDTARNRSDSVRSQCSIRSAPIFKRAGSFRQSVKSASLNNTSTTSSLPSGFGSSSNAATPPINEQITHSSPSSQTNNIVIQIDCA